MTTKETEKRQQPIESMKDEFEIPEAVQKAADKYRKAITAKNRAAEKWRSSKEGVIDAMKENNISRVRVLVEGGGEEILVLNSTDQIKIEKPKKDKSED